MDFRPATPNISRLSTPHEPVRRLLPMILLAVSTGVSDRAAAQRGREASTRDGIYTETQAARGAALAEEVCEACHLMSHEFTGTFLQSWNGAALASLYDVIRRTMPQNRPAALQPGEYADVLAYILSLNGVPAGATELTAQSEGFAAIRIDWRP